MDIIAQRRPHCEMAVGSAWVLLWDELCAQLAAGWHEGVLREKS